MADTTETIGTSDILAVRPGTLNSSTPLTDDRRAMSPELSQAIAELEKRFIGAGHSVETGDFARNKVPHNNDADCILTQPSGAIAPDSSLHSVPPSSVRQYLLLNQSAGNESKASLPLALELRQAQYHLDNAHKGQGHLERAAAIFEKAASEQNSLDGLVGLYACNYFGAKTEEPVYQGLFTLMDMRINDAGARKSLPYLKLLLAFSEASGLPPSDIDGLADNLQAGLEAKWAKPRQTKSARKSLPYLKLLHTFSETSGLPPSDIDGLADNLQAGLEAKRTKPRQTKSDELALVVLPR